MSSPAGLFSYFWAPFRNGGETIDLSFLFLTPLTCLLLPVAVLLVWFLMNELVCKSFQRGWEVIRFFLGFVDTRSSYVWND